jgi:hypothetical protein
MSARFIWQRAQCFCTKCYDGPVTTCRDSASRIRIMPIGFVRIPLQVNQAIMQQHNINECYNSCYHGTSIDKAKKVISTAQLLQVGDTIFSGDRVAQPVGHIADGQCLLVRTSHDSVKHKLKPIGSAEPHEDAAVFNPSRLFFTTPSLIYALNYSPKCALGGDTVQMCFEMKQDPSSVNVLCSTLPGKVNDPDVNEDVMEWFTDRRFPAIVPYALLVRIETPAQGMSA